MYKPYLNMKITVVKQYMKGDISREEMKAKLDKIERDGEKDEQV